MSYCTGFEYDIDAGPAARIADVLRRGLQELFPALADNDYTKTHVKRYVYTVDQLLPHLRPGSSILDVGTNAPFPFQVLISGLVPNCRFVVVQEHEAGSRPFRRYVSADAGRDLCLTTASYNVETAGWPFEDGTFDVILCTEVLEHLAMHPFHVFREARRCLREGGIFCLSTPNAACYDSCYSVLNGLSPYTFGYYHPHFGVYGHHNREYVVPEIQSLGSCTGLETIMLTTRDVYGIKFDLTDTIKMMQSLGKADNRGHIIFYLGQRTSREPSGYPTDLYLSEPAAPQG